MFTKNSKNIDTKMCLYKNNGLTCLFVLRIASVVLLTLLILFELMYSSDLINAFYIISLFILISTVIFLRYAIKNLHKVEDIIDDINISMKSLCYCK